MLGHSRGLKLHQVPQRTERDLSDAHTESLAELKLAVASTVVTTHDVTTHDDQSTSCLGSTPFL